MCASLQGYDLSGITQTWWDGSCDWSFGIEGYRLFRKDRQGRQGGAVTLYVMTSCSIRSSAHRRKRSQLRVYRSGLKGGQGQVTL